jgi:hypothetical protein
MYVLSRGVVLLPRNGSPAKAESARRSPAKREGMKWFRTGGRILHARKEGQRVSKSLSCSLLGGKVGSITHPKCASGSEA